MLTNNAKIKDIFVPNTLNLKSEQLTNINKKTQSQVVRNYEYMQILSRDKARYK